MNVVNFLKNFENKIALQIFNEETPLKVEISGKVLTIIQENDVITQCTALEPWRSMMIEAKTIDIVYGADSEYVEENVEVIEI